MELLERSPQFDLLDKRLAGVRGAGRGRLVLLAGEAGVGKTALVRAFCERHAGMPVLTGACEALFTPRPLGPFLDIAAQAGGEFEAVAEHDPSPADLLAALSRALRTPLIIVLEDLHWADEATLDVLRLLGRRVTGLSALVIATYRDEQMERVHPLRVVLGELTDAAVDRLNVEALSLAAVQELAAGRGIDGQPLYERTGGNAFFVTEVLAAHGAAETPRTVRDAVLARAARLSEGARMLLEAVAVVPPRAELWLLEQLAGQDLPELEVCLASGMLRAEGNAVGFRHEIARVTIEDALPPHRRLALHRLALATLAGRADPARLAHHAEAAGDDDAVVEYASAAGERAGRLSAHREAAEQFARALRHAGGLAPEARLALLERRGFECYLTLAFAEAISAYERALEAHRAAGDRRGQGNAERWLSRLAWATGDNRGAQEHAFKAIDLLGSLPPGPELAMAYSTISQLRALQFDCAGSVQWGERAIALAERLGETEILAHALNNVGFAELHAARPGGRAKLERSLALALDAGLEDHAARAYTNLASTFLHTREYALADKYFEAGIAYAVEHELDMYRVYMTGWAARSEMDQGRWNAAVELATSVIDRPGAHVPSRVTPLAVIGRLRARRGEPDPWGPLDEALELARPTGELQRLAPVAAARAEARWLGGEHDRIAEETTAVLELAMELDDVWTAGELCLWRHRAGIEPPKDRDKLAKPFRLELEDPAAAAAYWTQAGCPYEAALALVATNDERDLRASLAELQRLGARTAAALVTRRLRERGARDVRSGPRASTRSNPAGLTGRQVQVLELLARGERNADIANRLFVSERTVDHHVSTILRKLGVSTRGQAAAEAGRLGIGEK